MNQLPIEVTQHHVLPFMTPASLIQFAQTSRENLASVQQHVARLRQRGRFVSGPEMARFTGALPGAPLPSATVAAHLPGLAARLTPTQVGTLSDGQLLRLWRDGWLQLNEGEIDGRSGSSPFSDEMATTLAAELLEVQSEAELDQFLGDLVKKAWGGIKSFASSPVGQALVGGLKTVAKDALPTVAGAIGNMVVPGAGGAIGSRIGQFAASQLEQEGFLGDVLGAIGLEQEGFLGDVLGAIGLEQEDKPIDKAKKLVHIAGAAARKAERAPMTHDLHAAVRDAVMEAVKEYAPTMLRSAGTCGHAGGPSGHWYRRGNKIVIVGA